MLVGALCDVYALVYVLVPMFVPVDGVCLGLFFRLCLSLLLGSNRLCYARLY